MPTNEILNQALAAIDILGAKAAARREAIRTDRRVSFLTKWIVDHELPITGAGMLGGMQVFAALASDDRAQIIRARALVSARIGQIDGSKLCVRLGLEKAVRMRREFVRRTSEHPADVKARQDVEAHRVEDLEAVL